MIFSELVSLILMLIGVFFMMVAAIGVLRMPDTFLRMSASTKAATLGVGGVLLAVALHFNEIGIAARAIAIIVFVLLTAPIAAHMIGRAAYRRDGVLWSGTVLDELKDRYDVVTGELEGIPPTLRTGSSIWSKDRTDIHTLD